MPGYADLVKERVGFLAALEACDAQVHQAVYMIANAFEDGKKLFICGNGGSAADAQHMAAEFVGRFHPPEKLPSGASWVRRGLPAIALTTDCSALTAIANDWS